METHRIVTAAIGYCQLQMWQDAWEELETLEPEGRARPEVLGLKLGIFIAMKQYESAAKLAEGMVAQGDVSAHTWLQGALAIRRSRSVAKARAFLLRAEDKLQGNASFHYSLATFESLLGSMEAAAARLSRAITLNPKLKADALDDEDLWPIW